MMPGLSGWFAAHKREAMIGGVGGVAVLGLAVAKRKSTGAGATAGSAAGPAGSGVNDSTGTDLVNWIQPEIDTLAAQIASQGKITDKLLAGGGKLTAAQQAAIAAAVRAAQAKRPAPPAAWRKGLSAKQVTQVTDALGPNPTPAQLSQFGKWVSAVNARTPAKPVVPKQQSKPAAKASPLASALTKVRGG